MPFTLGLNKPQIDLAADPPPQRLSPREHLKALQAKLREMDDEALELELVAITTHVDQIRADLDADDRGDTTRGLNWRKRADAAFNIIRSESKLAHNEKYRRQKQAEREELERKQANFERQKLIEAEAIKLKHERLLAADRDHNAFANAFIVQAKALLRPATYQRIIKAAQEQAGLPSE